MRMWISLLSLTLSLASLASCQSPTDCGEPMDQLWTNHDASPTVFCQEMISQPKWWAVSDPCRHNNDAIELTQCSGNGLCQIPNDMLRTMPSCVICCSNPAISSAFTLNSVGSCTALRVCPEITISAPTFATTGTPVDLLTFVTTKPKPAPGSVTVHVLENDVPVVSSDMLYPAPGNNVHNYTFVHTLLLPQATSPLSGLLRVRVNVSAVPHGDCSLEEGTITVINLIKVNSNSSSCLATTVPPETTNPTAAGGTLGGVGIKPTEDSAALHPLSLAIGIVVGIVATFLVVVVIATVWLLVRSRCACAPTSSSRKASHQFTATAVASGGSRPLLTVNGTPATTPSSDGQHCLGQNSDTPASTPTEFQDLLAQRSQTSSEGSPYQEIQLNGTTHIPGPAHIPVVGESPNGFDQSTHFGREPFVHPVDDPPPIPQNPPPGYVQTPPRITQVAQSLTDQYHTQGEAMRLSRKYNDGNSVV